MRGISNEEVGKVGGVRHYTAMNEALARALGYLAVRCVPDARHELDRAMAEGSVMARALLSALDAATSANAYDQPRAFEVFIRAGGNPALYRAVSAAFASVYEEHAVARLLDIGAGDGMALLPALAETSHVPLCVDVVEPSVGLLDMLRPHLPAGHVWPLTLQAFVSSLGPDDHWDLAQASFALQSIPPEERAVALGRLRPHITRLAIVEFDVPVLAAGSDALYASLARRYECAAREYGDDAGLVAGGFLAPMLLGQLRATTPSNWEQSIRHWQDELRAAGYAPGEPLHLHDYSWSPAYLLLATA